MRACNAAIQIHGGYGYTREFPVERYLRDAKLCRDRRGHQRGAEMVIARELLKDGREPEPIRAARVARRATCAPRRA